MERPASHLSSHAKRKWRHIKIHGSEYMISTSAGANSWKIVLSNLVEIWTETITKDIALSRCQSLNLLLDLDSFNLKETLGVMLNDIPDHVTEISVNEIKLETRIDGIVFKFTIHLAKGNAQQFWDEITKPLCRSSMGLQHRYEILLNLIQKKDEELLEYKLGGAQLTRKNIETQPFDQDIFRNGIFNRHKKSENCIDEFISMVDLDEDSRDCESRLNSDHPSRISQEPGFSGLNSAEPGIKTEVDDAGASETLPVDFNSHESRSRLKTESAPDKKPPIRESGSIALGESKITEECQVGRTLKSTDESKKYPKTKKHTKKRSTVNDIAEAPLASMDQPKKRPKSAKNIYDLIV